MTSWWDGRRGRYRYSIPYKFFYVWTWPATRWVMHSLPEEAAHRLAVRGIWWVDQIDSVWCWAARATRILFAVTVLIPILLVLRLLLLVPGFRCEAPAEEREGPR